ncbi:secretion protein EspA [Parashewanella tropica]|uniref:secretion protein EspA n=1 Tax=Parashewanella tropica TaxID=2547970 RepID=UPI001FEA054D|nr:secretion protein EspA [Parashewanella tropica]
MGIEGVPLSAIHQLDPKMHYGALQGVQDLVKKKKSQKVSEAMNSLINEHISEHTEHLQDVDGMDKWSVDQQLAQQGDSVLSGGIAVLYLFMNLLSELANDKYLQMQQKAKVSRDAQDKANEVNEKIADVSKQGDKGSAELPDDVITYMRDNGVKVDGKSIDEYLTHTDPDFSYKVTIPASSIKQSPGMKLPNGQPYKAPEFHISIKPNGDVYFDKGTKPYPYQDYSGKASAPLTPYTISGNTITFHNFKVMDTGGEEVVGYLNFSGTIPSEPGQPPIPHVKLNKGQLEAVKDALENVSNRASDFVSQAQLQLQKIMQTYNVTVSLINSMQTMLQEMNKSIAQNIR